MRAQAVAKKVLVRDPAAVTRRLAGDTVILPVRHRVTDLSAIYTLNETGSFLWDHVDGHRSVADLIALVAAEYDVAAAEAERDVGALIADLISEGLVEEKTT
jgi:Mrp family chromosome partitioning ATPase